MQYDAPETSTPDAPPAQAQMAFDTNAEAPSTTASWIEASRSERAASHDALAEAVPVYREPESAPMQASAPAPSREREPQPPRMELPTVSLTLPEGSDLVLVETTHAAAVTEEQVIETARPRRVRPPRTERSSEALEMVETRKDAPPAQ
jgi:hypothetical protein